MGWEEIALWGNCSWRQANARGRVGQRVLLVFSLWAVSLFFSDYVHLDVQLQRGEEVLVQVQGTRVVYVHLDEKQLQKKGGTFVFHQQ